MRASASSSSIRVSRPVPLLTPPVVAILMTSTPRRIWSACSKLGATVLLMNTDFAAQMRRVDRWDFSVSSNPLSSEVWAKVYPVAYENLEVGSGSQAYQIAATAAAQVPRLNVRETFMSFV